MPLTEMKRIGQLEQSKALESIYTALAKRGEVKGASPNTMAKGWRKLGDDFRAIDQPGRALDCYQRAFDLVADQGLLLPMARLFEGLNRLEEGRRLLERVVGRGSGRWAYLQARFEYREGENRRAVQRLENLLEDDKLAPKIRISALYLLGQVYDRRGRRNEAIHIIAAANRLAKEAVERKFPQFKKRAERYLEDIECKRAWYTDRRHASLMAPQLPGGGTDFFIVGFPRSGTTLLDQIIDANPAFEVIEELDAFIYVFRDYLFGNDRREAMWSMDRTEAMQLADSYRIRLSAYMRTPDGMPIDKFPLHVMRLDVIRRFFPSCKIIMVLRDPRDVVLSNYFQRYRINWAVYHFLSLEQGARLYAAVMDFYLQVGRKLGLDIMEVRYEELIEDLPGVSRRLMEFLEVPWHAAMLDPQRHSRGREIKTPSYSQVCRPLYRTSTKRWVHYADQLAPALKALEPFVEALGYEASEQVLASHSIAQP